LEVKNSWFEFLIGKANYFEEDPWHKYWFDWSYNKGYCNNLIDKAPYKYWDLDIVFLTLCFTWTFCKKLTPTTTDDIL